MNASERTALIAEVTFLEAQTILTVHGEIDFRNAAELETMLCFELDKGHRSLVLDVAAVDFINGSGLQAIINAAARCEMMGGTLTVRSPSSTVRQLLKTAGISTLVHLDQLPAASCRLGPEQIEGRTEISIGMESNELIPYDRRVMAFPADHEVVDGALRLVVTLAKVTVGGADGVSVSLRRHGVLSTVAASDQTILSMDADQYATGEGPCVDASNEGRWFHAESLGTEARWPEFTPRARTLGINAILSSPLLARDNPIGALNIYSRTEAVFSPTEQELASVFAKEASTILTNAGTDISDEQLDSRYVEALWGREIIAQAQGVMMERLGIGRNEAFSLLRQYSTRSGEPLRERAEDIVRSTRPIELNSGGQSDRSLHA